MSVVFQTMCLLMSLMLQIWDYFKTLFPLCTHSARSIWDMVKSRRVVTIRNDSYLRPQSRRDYPPNLSILFSGGKETNQDSLSNGERKGKSPALNLTSPGRKDMWRLGRDIARAN